ncbi:MAG: aminotransferase class I/II-fold pyridoxal phosphate-dependent enzyme, partial [Cyanobacteria bacterium]|nr:aminotransferase class I/II-fold pyridoxal phosphate-dependent enzyme [Cyanobacteriota bacterium]
MSLKHPALSHLPSFADPLFPENQAQIQSTPSLYQDAIDYLSQSADQLHRYPEEEYQQVLNGFAAATGWPEPGFFIGKSIPELLEFLVEMVVGAGDVVGLISASSSNSDNSDSFQWQRMLETQIALRQGELCQWELSSAQGVIDGASKEKIENPVSPKLLIYQGNALDDKICAQLKPWQHLPVVFIDVPPSQIPMKDFPLGVFLYQWAETNQNSTSENSNGQNQVTLSPLPVAYGVCLNQTLAQTLRNVQEPFHIPTHLLLQMLKYQTGHLKARLFPKSSQVLNNVECPGILEPIAKIQPYVPGKGIKRMSRELGMPTTAFSKLASNEHPFGVSPEAIGKIKEIIGQWHSHPPRYSDISHSLKSQLIQSWASWFEIEHLEPNQILFGTGSVELIKAIIQAFVPSGGKVLFPEMPFAMYPYEVNKRLAGSSKVALNTNYQLDLSQFIEAIHRENPHVIFLANPRNPLGTAIQDLSPLIEAIQPHQVLVLDEAYIDFIREEMGHGHYPEAIPLLMKHLDKNIIALRTFSKGNALASFRIGFSVSRLDLAQAMAKVILPCPV